MNRHPHAAFAALLTLLLLTMIGIGVLAQTSADFNLEWHVLVGSGGPSASADYVVNGTVGQSLAGPPQLGNDTFVVNSGYWQESRAVYLPLVARD
jgi:hypothetical protein